MTDNEIQEMFEAFNRHDTDAVMTFFHDDIVFETASGPESYGTRFEGKEAVRKQFEDTWGSMPDVRWLGGNHYVSGGCNPPPAVSEVRSRWVTPRDAVNTSR
jgi:taurine dehydrogenase small subunit